MERRQNKDGEVGRERKKARCGGIDRYGERGSGVWTEGE